MARGGHLTPISVKRAKARLSAPGPTLCSVAQSECARPLALQPGACFPKVRPRQSLRYAILGIRERLAELPRGARDQWRRWPLQHGRQTTREQAVRAEAWRALPARYRARWACCGRGHRVQARLGCCARNRAPRRDKRCAAVPVGLWSDHPTRLRSGAVWVAVLRRGSLTGLPARNQAPWGC